MSNVFEDELCRVFQIQSTDCDVSYKDGVYVLSILDSYYKRFLNLVCNQNQRLTDFFDKANLDTRVVFFNRALPVIEYPEEYDVFEPTYNLCINCIVSIPSEYIDEILQILRKYEFSR